MPPSEHSLRVAREFCEKYADEAMMGTLDEDLGSTLPKGQQPIDVLAVLLERLLPEGSVAVDREMLTLVIAPGVTCRWPKCRFRTWYEQPGWVLKEGPHSPDCPLLTGEPE